MKIKIIILVLILVSVGVGVWYWQNGQLQNASKEYRNTQYGFSIALPDSWKGYVVLNSQWQGRDVATGNVTATGPIITLRHPLWTTAAPREDMPVMIFTPAQWKRVINDKVASDNIAVSAAPIPPSVLGQNSKYIIALPARYNYDYKTGFEEVDQLVHTLKAFEPAAGNQTACTQEAKQCPDGSYVGRTGPSCEFAACPEDGILSGYVTIGPNCPVQQVGVLCTPTPQAYTSRQVSVYKADGITLVDTKNFGKDGSYSFVLPVGTYVVKSKTGIGSVDSVVGTITIKNGQTTTLNFSIDTGIR